jgi:hypothetical protein
VGVVGPGLGIQRWARVALDPSLVLPLGAVQAAAAYWLSLASGQPWLFPALVVASTAGLLRGRGALVADRPSWRALVAPVVALVALLALTQYAGNRPAADGGFLLDPMGDQPLHAGIAWELTLPYPPQVPGLAGVPLHYHYGADLVRAAALRWTGLQPYDALNRIEPTLWALGLMLVLAAFTLRIGGGALAAAVVPWSVLATDFSFVSAAFGGVAWWSDLLRGNLLISLAFANPVVPALMVALGALVALSRFEAGQGTAWLGLACAQACAVPFFKVFLGAQLGLALVVAAAWAGVRSRRRPGAASPWPLALLVLACLPGVIGMALGAGGEQVAVTLAPLRMIADSIEDLHLEKPGLAGLALAAVPWIVASLGLRLAGLRRAALAAVGSSGAAAVAGVLALTGWPLGLLFHAAARDIEGNELPTATIYFVEQSGAVLWIFAVVALAAFCRRGRSGARTPLALAVAALLVFPSTIEFTVRKARTAPDPVPAAYVRAVRAIQRDSRPGDRVLQRPIARYPPLPVVLVGRRVVYERFTVYLTQFAPATELRRRHEALYRFFRTTDRDEAAAIARSLGTSYLCLYGGDRIRFDGRGLLVPLHEEPGGRAYRLSLGEPAGR